MAAPLAAALLLAAVLASAAAPEKNSGDKKQTAVLTKAKILNLKKTIALQGKTIKGGVAKPSNVTPAATSLRASSQKNEKLALRKDEPINNEWITNKTTAPAPAPQAFHASLNAQRSRSMVDFRDGSLKESNDFQMIASLSLSPKWTTALTATYSQDTKDPEGSDLEDVIVSVAHAPWSLTNSLNFSTALVGLVPASKASSVQTFRGAGGVSFGLSLKPAVMPTGLTLSVGASVVRLSHEYETSIGGKMNNAWSSRQNLLTSYTYKKATAAVVFYHTNAWSYQNTMKEAYQHAEELSYAITENFSMSLGHTLAGPALKPNGIDSNVALMDENKSIVYAGMTVSY